ncbi:MAG: Ger(x)C family spore germination C-terminal domain-containing protein [Oscillospiraceae bacterium]
MRNMRRLCVLLMLLCILILPGCSGMSLFSNYREIEDLELIRTVGVDSRDEEVNVMICTGVSAEGSAPRMYETKAGSFGVALSDLQKIPLGKEALLSHTENLLIGEEEARKGISEELDYVERFSEMRLDTSLFIVREGTARDLMKGVTGKSTSAADILMRLKESLPELGAGFDYTCKDTAVSLAGNGTALVMAIKAEKDEKLFEDRGDMKIVPAGLAVIEDGKLVDFLNEEETRGVLLLTSKFKADTIELQCGDSSVTLTADGAKTDITPEVGDDGRLKKLHVRIKVEANVVNVHGTDSIEDSKYREKLQKDLSDVMKGSAEAAIARALEMDADFLDFTGTVWRAEPLKFDKSAGSFKELFENAEITVEGESILRRTYDLRDPLNDTGEEEPGIWERLTSLLKGS